MSKIKVMIYADRRNEPIATRLWDHVPREGEIVDLTGQGELLVHSVTWAETPPHGDALEAHLRCTRVQ